MVVSVDVRQHATAREQCLSSEVVASCIDVKLIIVKAAVSSEEICVRWIKELKELRYTTEASTGLSNRPRGRLSSISEHQKPSHSASATREHCVLEPLLAIVVQLPLELTSRAEGNAHSLTKETRHLRNHRRM